MALLVLLVLVLAVAAPALAYFAGVRIGVDRGARRVLDDERRDLLDRMERAEISGQQELLSTLGELYRSRFGRPDRR